MIAAIVYENTASSSPTIENISIFFAPVAASSLVYAVKYLIPLTTTMTRAAVPTNPISPVAHPGSSVWANHALSWDACWLAVGPGSPSGFGMIIALASAD